MQMVKVLQKTKKVDDSSTQHHHMEDLVAATKDVEGLAKISLWKLQSLSVFPLTSNPLELDVPCRRTQLLRLC